MDFTGQGEQPTSDAMDAASSPSSSASESLGADNLSIGPTTTTTANAAVPGSPKKRPAPATETTSAVPAKITKRRAARACVQCRARKVRCDVVEGAPCGNCRWDNVECIVQESRRRKKNLVAANAVGQPPQAEAQHQQQHQQELRSKATAPNNTASSSISVGANADPRRPSNTSGFSSTNADAIQTAVNLIRANSIATANDGHVPHMIYQRTTGYHADSGRLLNTKTQSPGTNVNSATSPSSLQSQWAGLASYQLDQGRTAQFLSSLENLDPNAQLPHFVRPLPSKIAPEDVAYLQAKGALTLPDLPLQNALLQSFVEYVHPYMPLLDLHEFLNIINHRDGLNGQTSLLLYQAVMFSSTAFVEMKYLREAGYSTRKAARKAFFSKTRLLYDFDYESDRLVLVQSLMFMTYWYETPDDQKDTWHWMGVAISLAHTIGLHRNPESTNMAPAKQKLWKRIWWSCFMRDRLIALGMRRPTRIKDEDFDVPMLVESDFEIAALADSTTVIPSSCTLMRNLDMQRELAMMCISKAKLCVCISHMLKAQYSVLIRDKMKPENTTNSTMMLFPNKQLDNVNSVNEVDAELKVWAETQPACCQYRPITSTEVKEGQAVMAVQRTLLYMVYYTTLSALHRPQFLPSSPLQTPTTSRQVQEMSRVRVRESASQITAMASELHRFRLERFLPTTGVTVILPAMIIHLLEMKNPLPQAREVATQGFRQCMVVMERLRDIYAAADYATGFLDAALKKAAIDVHTDVGQPTLSLMKDVPLEFSAQTPPPDNAPYMTPSEALLSGKSDVLRKAMVTPPTINAAALDLSANSPPQTDSDPANLTPSVSGGSEETQLELDMDMANVDFMQGHDEFDWNAVAGTDFDVDQFLQFPPEGVSNTDESFVASMFNNNEDETTKSTEPTSNTTLEAETIEAPALAGGSHMEITV